MHRSLMASGAEFFRLGDGDPEPIPVTDQSPIERVECSGFATSGDVKGVRKVDVARCQIKGESHLLGILEDDVRQAGQAAKCSGHVMTRKSIRTLQNPRGFQHDRLGNEHPRRLREKLGGALALHSVIGNDKPHQHVGVDRDHPARPPSRTAAAIAASISSIDFGGPA